MDDNSARKGQSKISGIDNFGGLGPCLMLHGIFACLRAEGVANANQLRTF